MGLILLFGTPTAYLLATRRSAGARCSSRWSSCRSYSRRRSRASGCSPPSGASDCSAAPLDALGIEIAFTKLAVVLAVTFVASPFYVADGDRRVRGRRSRPRGRVADARRRARRGRSPVSRSRSPRAGSARRGARLRARARGVRRDDHVRRLAPGRHADALARRLPGVRRRLRPRARDRRAARGRQRLVLFAAKLVPAWTTLRLDLDHGLRSFRLELALEVGAETVALVGPSGAGKSSVLRAVAGLLRPDARRRVATEPTRGWTRLAASTSRPSGAGRARLPGVRAVPAPRRSRQRRVRRARPAASCPSSSSGSASASSRTRVRRSSRAGSGNGSRSPARSPASPTCCSSTSRCRPRRAHARHRPRGAARALAGARHADAARHARLRGRGDAGGPVGVLVDGRILQLGRPEELVAAPSDSFVASFTGANLLPGVARPGSRRPHGGDARRRRNGLDDAMRARAGSRSRSIRGRCRSLARLPTTRPSTTCERRSPRSSRSATASVSASGPDRGGHRPVGRAARARGGRRRRRLVQGDGRPAAPGGVACPAMGVRGSTGLTEPELAALREGSDACGRAPRLERRTATRAHGGGRQCAEAVDTTRAAAAGATRLRRAAPAARPARSRARTPTSRSSAARSAHQATSSLHAPAAASPAIAAASACAHVFTRPRSRAPSTTPRSTAARRRPETRISRTTIRATIHAGATPSPISMTSAASTSTLSATGSRSLPRRELVPRRRASQPSIWSVAIATTKTAVAQ